MEQRDLLRDQIEQLGKVLAKILADFLGLKSEGKVSQGMDVTNQNLQSQLDVDIEKVVSLTKTELKDYLTSRSFGNFVRIPERMRHSTTGSR